jgi:hypothetical protein
MRIDDATWENAKAVAAMNDITVTAMVVSFLKRLHVRVDPAASLNVYAKQLVPKEKKNTSQHITGQRPRPEVPHLDPNCTHPTTKAIPFGTFCTACGKRMV